ncbi:hypothetical protein AN191_09960 [Loktanella sp. 5RATIMAR09]|nr:hypothetical protein AN191_09960 [Loktanella sp. 5RATIMAR09]
MAAFPMLQLHNNGLHPSYSSNHIAIAVSQHAIERTKVMSITTNTFAPAQIGARISARISAQLAALKEARAQKAVYYKVRMQLNRMSDRDLADIGTNRLLIDDLAREAAFGKAEQ